MRDLKCQVCGRTYGETMNHNIGFYCDSDGNQLCFTCKEIHEKADTGLMKILQENQALKDRWQKLKDSIKSIENANWISKQGVLIAMQELEKD